MIPELGLLDPVIITSLLLDQKVPRGISVLARYVLAVQ